MAASLPKIKNLASELWNLQKSLGLVKHTKIDGREKYQPIFGLMAKNPRISEMEMEKNGLIPLETTEKHEEVVRLVAKTDFDLENDAKLV